MILLSCVKSNHLELQLLATTSLLLCWFASSSFAPFLAVHPNPYYHYWSKAVLVKPRRHPHQHGPAPARHSSRAFSTRYVALEASSSSVSSSSTSTTTTTTSSPVIRGLVPEQDFERLEAIHVVLQELTRSILPNLLTRPLTYESSSKIFADDTRVVIVTKRQQQQQQQQQQQDVGDKEEEEEAVETENLSVFELCSSLDELISISSSVVLAVAASTRAESLVTSTFSYLGGGLQQQQPQQQPVSSAPAVDCKILLPLIHDAAVPNNNNNNNNNQTSSILVPMSTTTSLASSFIVEWETRIAATAGQTLKGTTEFVFDNNNNNNHPPEEGTGTSRRNQKISLVRLLHMEWNNISLDATAIGETLSILRSRVRSLQDATPIPSLLGALVGSATTNKGASTSSSGPPVWWNLLQDELLTSVTPKSRVTRTPIYVLVPSRNSTNSSSNNTSSSSRTNSTVSTRMEMERVLVDDYCHNYDFGATATTTTTTTTTTAGWKANSSGMPLPLPLPGSQVWSNYARAHRIVTSFVHDTLPVLSGSSSSSVSSSSTSIESLLSPEHCQWVTLDGSVLFGNAASIAKLFYTLAAWRQRLQAVGSITSSSSSTTNMIMNARFQVMQVELLQWNDHNNNHNTSQKVADGNASNNNNETQSFVKVAVRYNSTLTLPSIMSTMASATSLAVPGMMKAKPSSKSTTSSTTSTTTGGGEARSRPRGAVVLTVEGTDEYTLDPYGRIREIEQKQLLIHNSNDIHKNKGSATSFTPTFDSSSQREAVWFMRSLAAAMESTSRGGRDTNVLNEQILQWTDSLLQRLVNGEAGSSSNNNLPFLDIPFPGSVRSPTTTTTTTMAPSSTLERSDAAAATIYRIMDALHRQVPTLVNPILASSNLLPPASDYMTDNVQLLGYLGETLLKDKAVYERSWKFTVASFRAAVRSGRLASEKDPAVKVELTPDRNIRLAVTLYLRVKEPVISSFIQSATAAAAAVTTTTTNGDSSLGSAIVSGIPLRLSLISEYLLDPLSGRIVKHQLQESRVNGQLTPGDVVSRWILQQGRSGGAGGRSGSSSTVAEDADSLWKGLVDTINWVRSIGTSSTSSG